jgi:hypothetical protein
MSRPQKFHKPIKGDFNNILAAVALGTGAGKRTASKLERAKRSEKPPASTSKKP